MTSPDLLRSGNANSGDGFSEYEEYRGFLLSGSWISTSSYVGCVFIRDQDGLGLGYFPESQLCLHLIQDGDSNAAGVMNWSSPAATKLLDQKRILFRDLGARPNSPSLFGETFPVAGAGVPNIPSAIDRCEIYPDNISAWVEDPQIPPAERAGYADRLLQATIAHELAHAVNMTHHSADAIWTCVMKYPTRNSIRNPANHSTFCVPPDRGEVLTEMKLR